MKLLLLSSLFFSLSLKAANEQDVDYTKSNEEFFALANQTSEIASKECTAAGDKLPRSLEVWFKGASQYVSDEVQREENFKLKTEELKTKLKSFTSRPATSEVQLESLLLQLDIFDLAINSLYAKDGRINARRQLSVSINELKNASEAEDKKWRETFDGSLIKSLNTALETAAKSCKGEKPAKGCDQAKTILDGLLKNEAIEYKNTYERKNIPSKVWNEDLAKIETTLKGKIAGLPDSDDKNVDWKTPASNGLEKIIKVRKDNGVICLTSNFPNWIAMDAQLGQPFARKDLGKDLEGRVAELIKKDQEKVLKLREQRVTITKLLVAMDGLQKYKKDAAAMCGQVALPPGGYVACPSNRPTVWCDPESPERMAWDQYKECKQNIKDRNEELDALSNVAREVKNNPNFEGMERRGFGIAGTIFQAKIRGEDGSSYYSSNPHVSLYEACKNGGFVPGGTDCTTIIQNGEGLSQTPAPKKTQTESVKKETTDGQTERKKVFLESYKKQIADKDPSMPLPLTKECGVRPSTPPGYIACPSKVPTPWCDPNSKARIELDKFNACASVVNEHNELADARINLSAYIKNNPEFTGVSRDDSGKIMARMKRSDGTFYYLPLNYNP